MLDGLDWNERTSLRIHIHITFAAREGITVMLVDRVQGPFTMDTKTLSLYHIDGICRPFVPIVFVFDRDTT